MVKISIIFDVGENSIDIELRRGAVLLDRQTLTKDRNLDTLLIKVLDNILFRNKIERLSLKSVEIRGNIRDEAVSGMILKTIKKALEI